MKNELRTKTVGCKMTESEHALIEALAQRKNRSVSDWCRDSLIACVAAEPKGIDPARTVLEEILALRTIVSTILFRLANGQKIEEEQMTKLIEKADGSKGHRAEELLRQTKGSVEVEK
jgi:hypothetical protein